VVRGNGESRSAHGEPPNDKRERELEREKMRKRLTIVKPPETTYDRAERRLTVTWKSCDDVSPQYKVSMAQIESKECKTVYKGGGSTCDVDGLKPGKSYSFW
jgi:hypothetical protein